VTHCDKVDASMMWISCWIQVILVCQLIHQYCRQCCDAACWGHSLYKWCCLLWSQPVQNKSCFSIQTCKVSLGLTSDCPNPWCHTHIRARFNGCSSRWPGLAGFLSISPLTPSHNALLRQDKGQQWRKRSGGEVHILWGVKPSTRLVETAPINTARFDG